LQQLIQLFELKTIVAVGNTAQLTLNFIGIALSKLRHPSYGGKLSLVTVSKQSARGKHENITPTYKIIAD
jgi:hypothetical protein